MKKLFKRVSVLFAALMALSVSTVRTVEEVKAADADYVANFGASGKSTQGYTTKHTISLGEIGWTVYGGQNNNQQWAYFRMGGKVASTSTSKQSYTYTNNAIPFEISYVDLTFAANDASVTGYQFTVYSDSALTTVVDTINLSIGSSLTVKPSESYGLSWPSNSYYRLDVFKSATSSNKGADLKTISFYKVVSDPLAEIASEETKFSLAFDYGLKFREETAAGMESTIDFSKLYSVTTDVNNKAHTDEKNIYTATFSKGAGSSNPSYYTSGTAVRAYAKNTLTIESENDISEITFKFGSSDGTIAITADCGSFATNKWTGTSNKVVFTFGATVTSGNRRVSNITVKTASGTVEVLDKDNSSFANVNLAFGASVEADLFEGYTSVNGGILLENAANYTETTLAQAYADNEFNGIKSVKEDLNPVDGFYTVGSVVEIINGLVNEENKEFLSYEFVAAGYFELEDSEGNVTTVVLEQKVYSVKSMVEYYNDHLSALGIEDENVIKALAAFEDYLA